MPGREYVSFEKKLFLHPRLEDYTMHTHKDQFEILMFIRGDAEFRVEGSVYDLSPYDTIIASDKEMHRIIHHSDTEYERIVCMIDSDFFIKNDCSDYSGIIFERPIGTGNLIPYSLTKDTHYLECMKRLEEYVKKEGASSAVVRGVLIELLYILNECGKENVLSDSSANRYIKNVILYINEHLTENITLENLSEYFFVNKSYLCRIFKKHTGYTVNKYITHKRIMMVRELCRSNMPITQASIEAGFGNYSNFYKMYIKEMGCAPKTELKRTGGKTV